jgi:hypothetical protein
MKKPIITVFILIIIFLPCVPVFVAQNAIANPVRLPYVTFSGGLLPEENNNLTLRSAKVKIMADTSNLKFLNEIHFNGNYTIFNPEDDINITIGAPFDFYPVDNCSVFLNGTKIPFFLISGYQLYEKYNSSIWSQYLIDGGLIPYYQIFWVMCNISIPKNSSITLGYEFNTPSRNSAILEEDYYIVYDVGTARLWNGNITEVVEISIYKNLPTSILSEELCIMSNISNGMSYRWEWNEKVIEINYLGLYYHVDFLHEYDYIYNSIKFSLFSGTSLVVIFIFIKKRNYRIRNKTQKV